MKKQTIIIVAAAIILGGAAFYAGLKYGQNASAKTLQQRMQQRGGRTGGIPSGFGGGQGEPGGGAATGEILSKDSTGITVKLRDGGSKIIFLSGSTTEISKFSAGTPDDLSVGENVSINGKANSDGSITAQSVQIRPKTNVFPPTVVK